MSHPLDGCEAKLRRAEGHLQTFESEVVRFFEQNPYRITYEADLNALSYTFYIHDLVPPDPDWGLIIGDCIHNLRSALDHLAYQLAILGQGGDP